MCIDSPKSERTAVRRPGFPNFRQSNTFCGQNLKMYLQYNELRTLVI